VHDPDRFPARDDRHCHHRRVQKIKGANFIWRREGTRADFFDKLYGTDQVRLALQAGKPAGAITRGWQEALRAFRANRKPFLLYKCA